jgi:hypothetical protein
MWATTQIWRLSRQIANLIAEGDSSVQMLQQFKSEITQLQYLHSKRYKEDTIRAFGQDSTMTKDAKI